VRSKRVCFFRGNRPVAVWWAVNVFFLLAAGLARADTNVVAAQPQMITNQFEAYARVDPIAVLPVRAAETGVVTGPKISPGDSVQAGQKLAELGGPEISALLAQDEAALSIARTNLINARKSLAIQLEELASHLSTQLTVLQAESAVAQAQAALDTAQAQLRALRQLITMEAPADGTMLAVNAANGERVGTGQTIFTLQPADKLWLKAAYYGADAAAIHVGMAGQFTSASGGEVIPVKVSAVFGSLNPDGGESVGLVAATSSPGWLNGESGTVTLNGPVRSLVAVPTRALVLDQGQWWVLVHTAKGNQPRLVTPGPARGWQTFIERGLAPGAEVVVENAYLEFHSGISKNYQPPD
jgi:RND family efflux transporter MFP subunit